MVVLIKLFIMFSGTLNAGLGGLIPDLKNEAGHSYASAAIIRCRKANCYKTKEDEALYATAEANNLESEQIPSAGAEIGLYRSKEKKVAYAGGEVGLGAVARLGYFEKKFSDHVRVNLGQFDTGFIITDGVEAKVVGFGFYAGKRGFQVCTVFFCFAYDF